MASNNDKEKESPSGISGVSGPQKINRGHFFAESPVLSGTSGLTWTHQAKPVSLLGGALRDSPEGVVLNFGAYSGMQNKLGDIEAELAKMRKQFAEKATALGEAEKDIEKRKKLEERYKRLLDLYGVLTQVHSAAQEKLLDTTDEDFKKWLEDETIGPKDAFVMSIDIRRSTELMLKAREPDLFASFITNLCDGLKKIILDEFGIFDKFTGDGVLAFFPEFFSGEDAGYRIISAASKSHAFFDEHYKKCRHCFSTVLKETGLGIGIDYGSVHMVRINT